MKKTINIRFSIVCIMTLAIAFGRMIPHIPNFSPLGAVCLFGSAYFAKKWQAYLIPLVATWIGDLYLNNVLYGAYFNGFVWFYPGWYWQYGSYAAIILTGGFFFRKITAGRIIAGALGASVLFFILSNFGVWLTGKLYPPTFAGLETCFIMALPFFKNTLIGNIVYSGLLFGLFAWAESRFPVLKETVS
jgi:hypothetical protein